MESEHCPRTHAHTRHERVMQRSHDTSPVGERVGIHYEA